MKNKILSLIVIALFCIGMIPVDSAQAKVYSMKDVAESDDAYESIQEVLDQGWMSMTLGKFFPDKKVSRAEFSYILTKFNSQLKEAAAVKKVSFKDVGIKDKYAKYIELQKSQITYYKTKSGKYFKPNNYLTREDALVSIVKSLGYDTDEAISSGVDSEVDLTDILEDANKVSSAIKNIVTVGVTNELINLYEDGDVMYLYPKKSITRRELAQLLVNAQNEKEYGKTEGTNDSTDGEEPAIDNTSDEESDTDDALTVSNIDNVTKLPGIRTHYGEELGYIIIDIKGKKKIFYQTLMKDFDDPITFMSTLDYTDPYFIICIPAGFKTGDKIVIDSTDLKNSTSDFSVRYTNSDRTEYNFGDTAGEYYFKEHISSKMTLTVVSNDIRDGYFTGTLDGKLVTSLGEVVTFSNGTLKFRLPNSGF
jgi:hypothetical protein